MLSQNGEPYFKRTSGENRDSQLPSRFGANVRRAIAEGHNVRQFGDGEQLAVFHARGKTSELADLADVYTNRPFGKLWKIEKMLEPVFDSAGDDPFPQAP